MLKDVVEVRHLGAHRLYLRFEDGVAGEVDLRPRLQFDGVFAPLRDPARFGEVRVNSELGTVVWPGGADLDPDVLYAAVTGTERPGDAVVPLEGGARGVCARAAAAHLVQAPTLPRPVVVPALDELPGVEVRPARAVLVDGAGVGETGSPLVVERGQGPQGGELQHRAEQVVGVGRAAGQRHDRLPHQDLRHALGAGRIGLGDGHAAEGGA
mgnify:CR=1 FL=1